MVRPSGTRCTGQLEQIAAGYRSRVHFLTDLTLDPPDATSDHTGVPLLDEDYLILSTIHSAKGQEWRSVFVLNVVDGCIPSDLATGSDAEIEEERRLLYVDRFIPDNLLGLFNCAAWPAAAEPATAKAPNQGVRLDVGARLRSIWR
jgi:DNA helicase II / ATP-dependent DNA helicase PcrA